MALLSAPGSTLAPVPPPASLQGRALHPPAPPGERAGPAAAALSPETLHPALWLGHQLGRGVPNALPSGFAVLDAQLPGGGWPRRALTELLLPHPGVGEIRLLAPSLAATQSTGRLVMLFDPPATLSAWALAALGLEVEQLLVIDTRAVPVPMPGNDSGSSRNDNNNSNGRRHETLAVLDGRLWALEQALKSGHVGALVAWLPARLRGERLRRLQLAAQAHDGPAFMLREWAALQRPSAAPLRLGLRAGGADVLAVRLLKRRGPPLEAPLRLALPPVLSGIARQRAAAGVHGNARTVEVHNGALTHGHDSALTTQGHNGARVAPGPAGLPAATFVNLA